MSIPFHNPAVREKLFGGEGTVRVEAMRGALCAPFGAALHCELSPGGTVGAHRQERESELVLVLEGEAVLYVDAVAHPVSPGAVVALPLGSLLELDNASLTEPFRYLIVKARP